jgi:hypothetical protein
MKRTHPAFWGAGWAGLAVGGLMTVIGLTDPSESAQLAGGYGLMLMGSAVYLLGGLGLRRSLARRSSREDAAIRRAPISGPATANQA